MKGRQTVVVVLLALLIATNAWWAWQAFDVGITASYREAEQEDYGVALAQALAVLAVAAKPGATPEDVIIAATRGCPRDDPFEKDGFTWVGRLGFAFDTDGRLDGARTAWEPFEVPACR